MSNNEKKIAVIGPYDIVSVFRVLNIDCFNAGDKKEVLDKIMEVKEKEEYAVIMVVEDLLKNLEDDEKKILITGALPAILLIPSLYTDNNISEEKIRTLAEKAVGFNILKKN